MKGHNGQIQNCDKLKDSYTSYVYGDISPEEEKIISEHIKICQECANEVGSLRGTLDLLSIEHELVVPHDLIDNFESRIYKRMAMESLKSPVRNMIYSIINRFAPRRFILIQSSAVVMLIVGILIGVYEFRPFSNNQPKELYSISYTSAHKRIEQYKQKQLDRQWEDALLTRYVEGDDWDAASQFNRLIEENPGTSLASMADKELSKINADLKGGI